MMLTRANLFNPVHLKHRIFRKVSKPTLRDRLLIVARREPGDEQSFREPCPPTGCSL